MTATWAWTLWGPCEATSVGSPETVRYKRILSDRLHARDGDAQVVEARLACNILNRVAELGMPASYAVRM